MWRNVTDSECPSVLVSLHEHLIATMPTRTSELCIMEYQSILDIIRIIFTKYQRIGPGDPRKHVGQSRATGPGFFSPRPCYTF
jgi:hypothetical protein